MPLQQPKIPIPRLDRPKEQKRPAPMRLNRVTRACVSCRTRKIRCNGVQDCQNCLENASPCVYVASRKDRLKTATEHNQDMLQLLHELRAAAAPNDQQRIDNILAGATGDVAEAASSLHQGAGKPKDSNDEDEGEAHAEHGSHQDLDHMDEDLLRTEQSRATGYIGKNSEVQWFRSLHQEADTSNHHGKDPERPFGPPGKSTQASNKRTDANEEALPNKPLPNMNTYNCSFYLDDESLHVDFVVDAYELPPFDMADRLLKCYMQTVQNSFPILSKKIFTDQFLHYYRAVAGGSEYKLPPKWQAMLNLVFAIGAAHSHLVDPERFTDERDHLLYYSRAWELSLRGPWWFTHPDLAQMQTTGLLAFYYMSIGHVNRSWSVVGMAVRFGCALGLHVRNQDRTATPAKKETLARIWWATYSLDRTLSVITGRPSVDARIYYSVMLPRPITAEEINDQNTVNMAEATPSEASSSLSTTIASSVAGNASEPANSGSFLTGTIKLGMLSQNIMIKLYSPNVGSQSWKKVQLSIAQLLEDLDAWLSSLPKGLDPFNSGPGLTMRSERSLLKTYYLSTQILITRPCLCRTDRVLSRTQVLEDFNHKHAAICVAAAKNMAALLPDDMAVWAKEIYRIFPWWAAVHYVMQSIAVLLLEACYETEESNILPALKKLVRWLRALRPSNKTARRAYSITVDLLTKLSVRTLKSPGIAQDISELLAEDLAPGQTYEAFATGADPNAHWFTGEEFLEQYLLHETGTYTDSVNMMPSLSSFSGATAPPLQGLFTGPRPSGSPIGNLFCTEFDQFNPLPFELEETYIPDAHDEQEPWQGY